MNPWGLYFLSSTLSTSWELRPLVRHLLPGYLGGGVMVPSSGPWGQGGPVPLAPSPPQGHPWDHFHHLLNRIGLPCQPGKVTARTVNRGLSRLRSLGDRDMKWGRPWVPRSAGSVLSCLVWGEAEFLPTESIPGSPTKAPEFPQALGPSLPHTPEPPQLTASACGPLPMDAVRELVGPGMAATRGGG